MPHHVHADSVVATDGREPTGLRKGELARPRGGSGQVEMGSARGRREKLETKELKQMTLCEKEERESPLC